MSEPNIVDIPDYTEPLTAWRCWRYATSESHSRLYATNVAAEWKPRPGENGASCLRYSFVSPPALSAHDHSAPEKTCTCGFYARKNPDEITRMFKDFLLPPPAVAVFVYRPSLSNPAGLPSPYLVEPYAFGRVYLWGRVMEYDGGYRAQYAYPKSIMTRNPEDTALLRSIYRCEEETICTWESLCEKSLSNQSSLLAQTQQPPQPPPQLPQQVTPSMIARLPWYMRNPFWGRTA